MSQVNCNTEKKKYQHIDLTKRKIIEVMLRKGFSRKEICEEIGIAKSSLSEEIRRGETKVKRIIKEPPLKRNYYRGKETIVEEWCYQADTAQVDAEKKRANTTKHFKIFEDVEYIEKLEDLVLKDPRRLSLDVANNMLKGRHKGVSTRTLYNWVEQGLLKIEPMDLLLKVKRKPRSKIRVQKRKYGKSIDERPKNVETRKQFGHFEGDSIVGKEQKGQIITLVERKTRIGLMFKFNDKKAENMVIVLKRLKKQYGADFKKIFKSITFDNGSEFAYNEEMSKYTNIYYAHAYSSWERGSNENFNGRVRIFIPKGSDITQLKQSEIERINNYINTTPRRLLNYKTPLEAFELEQSNKKHKHGFIA